MKGFLSLSYRKILIRLNPFQSEVCIRANPSKEEKSYPNKSMPIRGLYEDLYLNECESIIGKYKDSYPRESEPIRSQLEDCYRNESEPFQN